MNLPATTLNLITKCVLLLILVFGCKPRKPVATEKITISPKKDSVVPLLPQPPSVPDNDSTIRVYLTFDDGPYQTTPDVHSMLIRKNVKASFFIIGYKVRTSPWHDSVFQRLKNTPHFKIYNHSYSHAITKGRIRKYYSSADSVWKDIDTNKTILQTGNNITRLPGMNTWRIHGNNGRVDKGSADFLQYLEDHKINEHIVGWDVEWQLQHSQSKTQVDKLLNYIKSISSRSGKNKKEIVILSHDYLYRTPDAISNMEYFIESLQQINNLQFYWVEELVNRRATTQTVL